jgi:glucans biosynthesis protein C
MQPKSKIRRFELDWLRVLAILGVFLYHNALIFAPDPFSLKNAVTYQFIDDLGAFAGLWGLSLIFIISGASAFYALGKVRPGIYLKGLLARLVVPLVFGTFTHIAFQVYLERVHKGEFSGTFFDFYPHYFDGMYGFGGNFAWMGLHLWYLELLFIFSLLCLPLFLWLTRSPRGWRLLQILGDGLAKPGAVYLLALPAIVLINVLDPETWGSGFLGDWSIFIYLSFFISGFVVFSNTGLQECIQRLRWVSLAGGLLSYPMVDVLWSAFGNPAFCTPGFILGTLIYCLSAWCWLLAILGFGMQHLNFTNPFLKYANEAVLPFYILHQTVLLTVGFFILQWLVPDLLKFLSILSSSFVGTICLYEILVRRINLLRFLFGMKLPEKSVGLQAKEVQHKVAARTM